jgi:hypothetical protein
MHNGMHNEINHLQIEVSLQPSGGERVLVQDSSPGKVKKAHTIAQCLDTHTPSDLLVFFKYQRTLQFRSLSLTNA